MRGVPLQTSTILYATQLYDMTLSNLTQGEHAIMAYCLGHTRALQLARLAQSKPTDAEKTKQLRYAYAHEAFAAHFLTDLFSSGHLRSPRRPLHNPNYVIMAENSLRDRVVWDFLCRYVRDRGISFRILLTVSDA